MSSENNHINYSAADIEMYLSGKLTAKQMHMLEKAALDDPFLAEAIEGYEGMKNTEWNNDLVALRSKIQEKGAVAKVIPLHKSKNNWWKTAAAILILGSGVVLTFVLTRDNAQKDAEPQIAQVITAAPENDVLPQENTTITESLNPSASGTTEEKKINKETAGQSGLITTQEDRYIPQPGAPVIKPTTSSEVTTVVSGNEQITSIAPPVSTNTVPLNEDVVGKSKAAEKKLSNERESVSRQQNVSNAFAKKEAALNNFFTAQVVGADNTPLPFTNISIKKDNFGTYADAKGMVRLVSTDSVLNIDVKSVGYLPKTITLRNNPAQTKIVLQEADLVYNDKTTMDGYAGNSAPKTRRAMMLNDAVVNVEPADGWDNYNTYVANNLEIPDATLKGDFNGAVELSFDVNTNGTISNIRVSKSMGAVYDEAAKRLIMEGPQWKVKKGRKSSAKVKVQF